MLPVAPLIRSLPLYHSYLSPPLQTVPVVSAVKVNFSSIQTGEFEVKFTAGSGLTVTVPVSFTEQSPDEQVIL